MRKIVKAKVKKGDFALITYTEHDGKAKHTIEEKSPVHQDFKNAIAGLTPHFVLLCGLADSAEVKSIAKMPAEMTKDIAAYAYSIGGNDDDAGIVISGQKTLKNGKVITINSPFTRFKEDEATAYKFIKDLAAAVEKVETEVAAYLDNGKRAPEPQMSMFDDVDDDDDTDARPPKSGSTPAVVFGPAENANDAPKTTATRGRKKAVDKIK